jgi:signal transduction histidine kinase
VKLRGRFTLWFALAALIPVAAAAVGTRELLSRNYKSSFEKRRSSSEKMAKGELSRIERRVEETVRGLTNPVPNEHPYVGGLLQELRNSQGDLTSETLDKYRARGNSEMVAAGLDMLLLVEADEHTILVAPHYESSQDDDDPTRAPRARTLKGKSFYTMEQFWPKGKDKPRSQLVVESVQIARGKTHRMAVVGGRIITPSLLELVRRPGVDARLVSPDGEEIFPPSGSWDAVAGELIRVPLPGPDGTPVAWFEVGLSDAELQQNLNEVTLLATGLGAGALLAMILVGFIVSRRITGDLDALVTGAQAASRGDLDHEVPVRTKDEIGAVAHAFNLMMVDLKDSKERLGHAERVAAWQEIARRLAHEIKNPLTPIQMAVETMRRTHAKKHPSFDEVFEESTATVLEEAGRLKRIVSEFSEFARMPKPELRPVDLNEVIASATSLYAGSVELVKRLDAALPEIEADRDCLQQVLLNLLENARDAIASRGEDTEPGKIVIETHTTRGGRAVALVIEDNGAGFPAGIKERLFTPYFTTKHAKGGTGLGLAIVFRIVTDHGGRISALDSPLGGARFVLELPTPGFSTEDLAASMSGHWMQTRDKSP